MIQQKWALVALSFVKSLIQYMKEKLLVKYTQVTQLQIYQYMFELINTE
jgi:hypothetical protein